MCTLCVRIHKTTTWQLGKELQGSRIRSLDFLAELRVYFKFCVLTKSRLCWSQSRSLRLPLHLDRHPSNAAGITAGRRDVPARLTVPWQQRRPAGLYAPTTGPAATVGTLSTTRRCARLVAAVLMHMILAVEAADVVWAAYEGVARRGSHW